MMSQELRAYLLEVKELLRLLVENQQNPYSGKIADALEVHSQYLEYTWQKLKKSDDTVYHEES